VSIRIQGGSAETADVRLVEHNGQVHVAVRGSGTTVVNSLRSDLSDLVERLTQRDMAAEVWHPALKASSASTDSGTHRDSDGNLSSYREQGSSYQESGRQSQHGDRRRPAPEWLEETDPTAGRQPSKKRD
jgi:sirohydrochlorin ferrochelatase